MKVLKWATFLLLLLAVGAAGTHLIGQDGKSPFSRRKASKKKKEKKPKKGKVEDYQKKIEKEPPSTAEDHLELAKWCRARSLSEQAQTHFEKALQLDPSLDEAKKELGWRKVNGEWTSPEDVAKMEKARRAAEHAIGIEVTLGVQSDIPKERLQEMADMFAAYSDDFWFMTRGNFYIKSIVASDNSRKGNVRVESAYLEKRFAKGGGMTYGGLGNPKGYMVVAGKCVVHTFVHEGGHLWLACPDEYMNRPPGCPECVMVGGNMPGFGPGKWKLCDSSNHTGKGSHCWDRIKKKHPNVKYPNPDWPIELPFETQITLKNNGS